MRAALILTTAATFLAHALLGCCWHHVHAAPAATALGQAASHCEHACGCSFGTAAANQSADDETPPPAAPSPCHEGGNCDEPGCVFVTTAGVGFSVELPGESWLVTSNAAIVPRHVASIAELRGWTGSRVFCADSLRSHLALGVLRI